MSESEFLFEDLEQRSTRFKILGEVYVAYEATADDQAKYSDGVMSGVELGPQGKPKKASGLSQHELNLLTRCVKRIDTSGEVPVTLDHVKKWPNRSKEAVVNWVKQNSDMETGEPTVEELEKKIAKLKETNEAKNDEG